MFRAFFLFVLAAGCVIAAPMNYTLTGTGSGYWNSQPFTNAAFTFTFSSDTGTIVHGTSCCSGTDSTPSGTTANVSVAGFSPATLSGDQAIFVDDANETLGIWHFNAAQYLTITNQGFANANLTTEIDGRSGVTWSYATPFPLSSGGTLYFTSVQNVQYSQGPPFGQPYTTSVTPSSGTQALNSTQTYTFVVGDTWGPSDLSGVDFQFGDGGSACWLFFDPTSNAMAVSRSRTWGPLTPIGSGGSTITGDDCTVNTAAVTVTPSGNDLSIAIPVQFTVGDNNTLKIYAAAQNKENNASTPYTQLGTVTVEGSGNSQKSFTLSVSPTFQYVAAGGAVNYTVTVADQNGFDEPITFNASAITRYIYFGAQPYGADGDPSQLSFSFNPATLTTSGTTTMTVTSTSGVPPADYAITVTGAAQTEEHSATVDLETENAPPQFTLSPTSGTGSSGTFTITWPDYVNQPAVTNFLISPSLDGSHACWIYYGGGSDMYLASDDGSSWTFAYHVQTDPFGDPTTGSGASNSQCTLGKPVVTIDRPDPSTHSGHNTLTIPLTFTPAFNGTKTVYLRGITTTGFDTGYQPKGGWTVQ